MNLKRHYVLYSLLTVSLSIALVVFYTPLVSRVSVRPQDEFQNLDLKDKKQELQFEIATSTAAQELGLGGRAQIPENYGMLFVFENKSRVGFWMKGMQTSIDIIWLSDSGTILGIEDNVSPNTYPKAFYAPEPVRYVLETKVGESRRQGWSVGSTIPLPLPYGK